MTELKVAGVRIYRKSHSDVYKHRKIALSIRILHVYLLQSRRHMVSIRRCEPSSGNMAPFPSMPP